jgi:hypothetical protein
MPLAKAASEMVRGGAIGSVSRKMDAGRLAQLRRRACASEASASGCAKAVQEELEGARGGTARIFALCRWEHIADDEGG